VDLAFAVDAEVDLGCQLRAARRRGSARYFKEVDARRLRQGYGVPRGAHGSILAGDI
jgi:hypothetical protein